MASGPKLAPLDETTAVEPPKVRCIVTQLQVLAHLCVYTKSPDHGASSKPSAVPKGGAKKNLWDLDRARTPLGATALPWVSVDVSHLTLCMYRYF